MNKRFSVLLLVLFVFGAMWSVGLAAAEKAGADTDAPAQEVKPAEVGVDEVKDDLPPKPEVEVISLDNCVRYALNYSPQLHKRQITYQSQKLDTMVEMSKFDVELNANVDRTSSVPHPSNTNGNNTSSASMGLSKEFVGGFNVSGDFTTVDNWAAHDDNTANLSLSVSKVILGGGSRFESRYSLDNSLISEVIALNTLNRYRRELAYRVSTLYYGIIRSKQTLKLREMRLERAKKNLEHAIERENPLDIATARIEVPENEVAVLQARRAIQSSLDEMKELVGMELSRNIDIESEFEFKEITPDPKKDTELCFANDEEILNASLEKKKALREIRVMRERLFPEVAITASSNRDSYEGINLDGEAEYKVGLSLAWTLGRRAESARYKKARNNLRQQELNIKILKQEREKTIHNLARRLDESSKSILIREQGLKISERRVALYADRWENGEIDILEYIRSQNDHENNKIDLINQKTSYMELLSEYNYVTGRK